MQQRRARFVGQSIFLVHGMGDRDKTSTHCAPTSTHCRASAERVLYLDLALSRAQYQYRAQFVVVAHVRVAEVVAAVFVVRVAEVAISAAMRRIW